MTAINNQPEVGQSLNKNQIYIFEFLRSTACLMVVLEHVFLPTNIINYLHEEWCFSFGGLGIGVFTFISGYLIARSLDSNTISSFAWSRLFRIWPTYLTVLLIAVIVFKIFGYSRLIPTNEATLGGFVAQAFLIRDFFNMYNPLVSSDWTLIYEVQFYAIVAVSWCIYSKTKSINYFILSYIFIVAVLYMIYSFSQFSYGHGELAIQRSGGSMFCFVGTLYYFWKTRSDRASLISIPIAWLLGSYFFTYFFGSFSYGYLQVAVTQLQAIVLVLAALHFQKHIKRNTIVVFFADISFPLYLTHQTFGLIGLSAVLGYDLGIGVYVDRALWFGTVIIPGCYLIHILIERRMILNRKDYQRRVLATGTGIRQTLRAGRFRKSREQGTTE